MLLSINPTFVDKSEGFSYKNHLKNKICHIKSCPPTPACRGSRRVRLHLVLQSSLCFCTWGALIAFPRFPHDDIRFLVFPVFPISIFLAFLVLLVFRAFLSPHVLGFLVFAFVSYRFPCFPVSPLGFPQPFLSSSY